MRKADTKLFRDRQLLSTMIALRVFGWSTASLATLYGCDRSSIEAWCRKYGAYPVGDIYTIERLVRQAIPRDGGNWRTQSDGERINLGWNYADYIRRHIPIENKAT